MQLNLTFHLTSPSTLKSSSDKRPKVNCIPCVSISLSDRSLFERIFVALCHLRNPRSPLSTRSSYIQLLVITVTPSHHVLHQQTCDHPPPQSTNRQFERLIDPNSSNQSRDLFLLSHPLLLVFTRPQTLRWLTIYIVISVHRVAIRPPPITSAPAISSPEAKA